VQHIKVSSYRWVPPFVQGYVRDLRVRWALEEAGMAYDQQLIGAADQSSADYRAWQPFGQVPAYEEDGLALFESGAIVLHIAQRSPALMPTDDAGRARVQTWMFAALNTIEPPQMMLAFIDFQPGGVQDGEQALRARVQTHVDRRLGALADALGDRPYLVDDRFTAADLLLASVLRSLDLSDRPTPRPLLDAYLARCLDRPAFRKALADQMASFTPPPAA
jgi:glutathione S-transferase